MNTGEVGHMPRAALYLVACKARVQAVNTMWVT